MKIQISVDGVLYDMPNLKRENFEDCVHSEDCERYCFLKKDTCHNLCVRVMKEMQRRKNVEQTDTEAWNDQ